MTTIDPHARTPWPLVCRYQHLAAPIDKPAIQVPGDSVRRQPSATPELAGIFCAAQNIAEFWNVSTRPADKNGFGLTIPEVQIELSQLETVVAILPETLEVFAEWKRLVLAHEVRGVQVHDARLAMLWRALVCVMAGLLNGESFSEVGRTNPRASGLAMRLSLTSLPRGRSRLDTVAILALACLNRCMDKTNSSRISCAPKFG